MSRNQLSHADRGQGFTTRIVGVPKAESDAILASLFSQIAQNYTSHVRYRWEANDVAIWDNRVRPLFFFSTDQTFKAFTIGRDAYCHL